MSSFSDTRGYKNVIGIDLGTTNTYVTFCPYGTRNKIPLHLDGKTPAVDTAILSSDASDADPDVFPVIGEKATVTFGQADEGEIDERGYRYFSNFKVEITQNSLARSRAVDYLAALVRDAALNLTPLDPTDNRVIMGAPSEAGEDYRRALSEIALEAGLGQVEVMDEPIGALLSDLGSRRFPLSDVLNGYLVIDFGGGTSDFAFLKKGRVISSWGEFELGGRLFDDLFFQWFCEQNPGVLSELKRMRRDFYVWSYLCRQLK
ncbi:MAG: rod shape-determining protein, partial [Deltaproteobacteria bacterium]|nr:rod shape-determining protein [Deltaproteobacteria bacterium]